MFPLKQNEKATKQVISCLCGKFKPYFNQYGLTAVGLAKCLHLAQTSVLSLTEILQPSRNSIAMVQDPIGLTVGLAKCLHHNDNGNQFSPLIWN